MADRRKRGPKDMVMTMAIVLLVVALMALYGSNVAFAPGGKQTTGELPTAAVVDGFGHAAATLDFPVIVPGDVPESWHPNSFSVSDPNVTNEGVSQVGTLVAVRGGWITSEGAFIELVESGGSPHQLLENEFGSMRSATESVNAGGVAWQVTTGVRQEAAWTRTTGLTTFLITGNASEQDFVSLAEAVTG